ncbi:MAG TPA: hypothetical protein VFL36_18085 [Myxococcales bacterium]|nr:hypothetical protein [Myxococcales bacterium]
MDESLLPPPEPPARPAPVRLLALILVPAAALAAGTGVSVLAGAPRGDALVRWLAWSSAAGLLLGAGCGALFGRRLLWALHGALSPWLVAALVMASLRISQPVREALADRREAQCRSAGRAPCSAQEFRSACAARDRARLGPPAQSLCGGGSCTHRWTYAGPFRPDTMPARARLLCSIVTDSAGHGLRSSVIAVTDAE